MPAATKALPVEC